MGGGGGGGSKSLNDNLLTNLNEEELDRIQYYVNTCYSNHIKKYNRLLSLKPKIDTPTDCSNDSPETREPHSKRRKSEITNTVKTCAICNQFKCKGITKEFRVCINSRAKVILSAMKFTSEEFAKVYARENKVLSIVNFVPKLLGPKI